MPTLSRRKALTAIFIFSLLMIFTGPNVLPRLLGTYWRVQMKVCLAIGYGARRIYAKGNPYWRARPLNRCLCA